MSLSYNKSSPPIKFDGRKWRRGQHHTFPSRQVGNATSIQTWTMSSGSETEKVFLIDLSRGALP